MEVFFAVIGCLGAFVLGLAAGRAVSPQAVPPAVSYPAEAPLPPGLERQWEDFMNYTGRPEGGVDRED